MKKWVDYLEEQELLDYYLLDILCNETKPVVTQFQTLFPDFPQKAGETEDGLVKRIEKELEKRADNINKAFKDLNRIIKKSAPSSAKFLVDVKSAKSIASKLTRGYKGNQIHDIVRSAILLKKKEEVIETVKKLKRNAHIYEYEYKHLDKEDKLGYHGSHHFKIKVGEYIVEIQVMTKKLWAYKHEAHKIYEKYRNGLMNTYLKSELKRSRELFKLGNK